MTESQKKSYYLMNFMITLTLEIFAINALLISGNPITSIILIFIIVASVLAQIVNIILINHSDGN